MKKKDLDISLSPYAMMDQILKNSISTNDFPWNSPLEFFESDKFCNMHLYPNQRLMLKLWNLEIEDLTDYEKKTIDEWQNSFGNDSYRIGILPDTMERIYALKKAGYTHFSTIIPILGRRASKSFMSGLEMALNDAEMLWTGIPSGEFNDELAKEQDDIVGNGFWSYENDSHDDIQQDSAVYSIVMATTATQAQETIFKDYFNAVLSNKWLQQYIYRLTPFQISYQTLNDKLKTVEYEKSGHPLERPVVSMVSRPISSNSNAIRGRAIKSFCLSPDTDILMSDGSTRKLQDIEVGDIIAGFDEHDHNKRKDSEVMSKYSSRKPVKRIWFEDGSYIDATSNHMFVDTNDNWRKVSSLHVGDKIAEYDDICETDTDNIDNVDVIDGDAMKKVAAVVCNSGNGIDRIGLIDVTNTIVKYGDDEVFEDDDILYIGNVVMLCYMSLSEYDSLLRAMNVDELSTPIGTVKSCTI